ncbi:sugar ABC transporter substrate-binding protein [Bacillus sp. FJAT-49711]|uniref:ABC transporter substrate-binding protein n=1 Tax=Bacillus sp. FJAT-49711 TaxID=2833585 RepID=UPI001BCA1A1F|nr:sugar ABC transporter substrate-binding protein [Bacillus sp. FJAT-49711]MBS4220450.1 sugar ABC transporter substrate-binding protein [Bacillus sp. FJAT-49711]
MDGILKKKSFLLPLILLLLGALMLSGCRNSSKTEGKKNENENKSENKNEAKAEQIEIVWTMASDPVKEKWQKEVVASFEEKNPDIKVKIENYPYEAFDQKLITMISSGNPPDVWNPNQAESGFATYMQMGALKDLTPFIGDGASELESMNKDLLNVYKVNGKYYGVPLVSNATYLYFNKDLFDAEGIPYPTTDWDDTSWNFEKMLEVAQQLTHDVGDRKNQVFGFSNSLSPTAMAWAFGGDFFKAEAYTTGKMGEPDLFKQENIEALQYNVDLINKYKVSPNQSTLDAISQLGDPFMTGKVAMTITGGWGLGSFREAEFNWGIAAVPYHEGRKVPLYVDPWSISETSKHPEAAWRFVKHLADPEKEVGPAYKYMSEVGRTPADSTLFEIWYEEQAELIGMNVDEFRQVHEGSMKHGREAENHLIVKFNVIMEAVNQTMSSVFSGKDSVEDGLKKTEGHLRSLDLD